MKYNNIRVGKYRSKLEAAFAQALEENGIEFCYECERWPLIEIPSKYRIYDAYSKKLKLKSPTYIPDFVGKGWAVEIKGAETDSWKLKLVMLPRAMKRLKRNIPLYVVKHRKQFEHVIQRIKAHISKST